MPVSEAVAYCRVTGAVYFAYSMGGESEIDTARFCEYLSNIKRETNFTTIQWSHCLFFTPPAEPIQVQLQRPEPGKTRYVPRTGQRSEHSAV